VILSAQFAGDGNSSRESLLKRRQGPNEGDGVGDINTDLAIGAGLSDSCALCHGRPRGSAGAGGNVVTRPDSRDSPHLFGLGLKEMLADEITTDLRNTRALAIAQAQQRKKSLTLKLASKGVQYGSITGNADGSVDVSKVVGVDTDLRVKPFFAEGSTISIREFVVGALHKEMGLEASSDPDLLTASAGERVVTPSGMVLDGSKDKISPPPPPDAQNGNEIDPALCKDSWGKSAHPRCRHSHLGDCVRVTKRKYSNTRSAQLLPGCRQHTQNRSLRMQRAAHAIIARTDGSDLRLQTRPV
jgi:hypothetical protein